MGEGKLTPLTTPTPLNRQLPNIAQVIKSTISPHTRYFGQGHPRGYFSPYSQSYHSVFIAREHTDARYRYSNYVSPSVRLCVCLSVRDVLVSDDNSLTYRHSFFTIR